MKVKIKVNKPMMNYDVGTYEVNADSEGTPLDFFWQRRLKDAKLDGCCEIVKPATKPARAKAAVADKTKGDE